MNPALTWGKRNDRVVVNVYNGGPLDDAPSLSQSAEFEATLFSTPKIEQRETHNDEKINCDSGPVSCRPKRQCAGL
ncbi:hypothetical protein GCM10011297_22570 [Bacterioplanes sanyensis]|nr:hypothetical protein GCM10011297_22570 [Bacterioplanes sanyensis]